jgi:colanic acid/amylovoran biosynthesis protein
MINRYATLFMPREKISYQYCLNGGLRPEKLQVYTDFTSSVTGEIPAALKHLKGQVAVIPNMRMIDHGTLSLDEYLDKFTAIIRLCQEAGKEVFLLNHEGTEDEKLCEKINARMTSPLPVASNLNALQVKGLIAGSYLVISSRFHGVASALNSGVPCLATSWSHKYEMLFKDFGQENCVLNLENFPLALERIQSFLNADTHEHIHKQLLQANEKIAMETKNMWKTIWNLIGNRN